MRTDLAQIAFKLNDMGFPNKIVGNTIEATIPLPYSPQYVQPSFKLHYSPKHRVLFYQPNRYSTEKLLKNLELELKKLATEAGLTLATRKEITD
jgi:hypothetical protein